MIKKSPETTRDVLSILKEKGLPSNFCIVPFTNLILNPDATVSVCRQKGTESIVGDLKENTLEEIWNSEFMKQWRREFLEGNVNICHKEIKQDACNLCPDNYSLTDRLELSQVQREIPYKVTTNLNGRCNLKCVMCDVWQQPNGVYDDLNWWGPAEENLFPYLDEVEMLSGEPFIQKDTYRIFDMALRVNPDIRWSITTNGNWRMNRKIESYLQNLKFKNIIFSTDSFDEKRFSEIRLGGSLKQWKKTFKDVKSTFQNKLSEGEVSSNLVQIHFLVMKQNWREVEEALEFSKENNAKITLNLLEVPSEYSLLKLPQEEIIRILDYYFHNFSAEQLVRMSRILNPLIKILPKFERVEFLTQLGKINGEVNKRFDGNP